MWSFSSYIRNWSRLNYGDYVEIRRCYIVGAMYGFVVYWIALAIAYWTSWDEANEFARFDIILWRLVMLGWR